MGRHAFVAKCVVYRTEQQSMKPRVTFHFDLGSPYAYLAAERLETVIPGPVEWQPILLGGLFRATGRSSWSLGDQRRRQAGMAEIERRARDYGLPEMRWPDPWPTNYLTAMLATTFAFTVGRGRELTRQAFRNAFQEGWELSDPERVLATGSQAGLDRDELDAATRDPQIKQALRRATDAAYEAGVIGVPTLAIDDELFWGDDRLEDAAAHLASLAS
jgi:2-hydroxychromene-2-carboxylate isomerase